MTLPPKAVVFLFVGILFPTCGMGHLSWFGSGSKNEPLAESASTNTPTVSAPPSSITSFLFGTEVGKPGTDAAGDVRPLGGGMGSIQSILPPPSGPISGGGRPPRPTTNHHSSPGGSEEGEGRHPTQAKIPQSNSPGMPFHSTHLSPHLAKNAPRMPPRHPTNTISHLNSPVPDLSDLEGQTKSGSFSWMSPQGDIYDVSYVADVRPPGRTEFGSRPAESHQRIKPSPQESHYSYSPLRPTTQH